MDNFPEIARLDAIVRTTKSNDVRADAITKLARLRRTAHVDVKFTDLPKLHPQMAGLSHTDRLVKR